MLTAAPAASTLAAVLTVSPYLLAGAFLCRLILCRK